MGDVTLTEGRPPMLADGIELIGEYEGSGFKEPPSLVRRSDGQVIQLAPLLYSVAAKADGRHTFDDIAREVTAEIRRELDGDQVRFLVEEKLRPIGVLAAADGSSPQAAKADPFLALRFRAAVIPESVSNILGALFQPLFFAPVVLAVLAGLAVADWWLFFRHGVAQAIRQSLYHPGLFLPLFGAVVLSAAFHEIGHAAGCRYGGGRPGKMGCGLYLAWPAFYTDVTDAYRLGKRARLRTDLGGVYFNVVIVLATVAAYLVTGFEPLLLLVIVQHFEIAHQLLPVIRLDGYYIVADLTGVPDLFSRMGPILRSLVPGHPRDDRVTALKRWVRVAVTAWVMVVVPLLVFELLMVLLHLPRIVGTAWDSGVHQYHDAAHAFSRGDTLDGISAGLQMVVLSIPIVGILLVLLRSVTGGGGWLWSHTQGRPILRGLGLLAAGAGAVMLLLAWLPSDDYKPIQPGERGTMAEGIRSVRRLPSRKAPLMNVGTLTKPRSQPAQGKEPSSSTNESTTTTIDDSTSTTEPHVSTTVQAPAAGTARSTTTSSSSSTSTSTTEPSTTTTSEPPSTTTTAAP